jgi:cytochrome c
LESRPRICAKHSKRASVDRRGTPSPSLLGPRRRWELFAAAAGLVLAVIVSVCALHADTNGPFPPPLPADAKASPRETANGKAAFDQHCEICHYAESTAQKIGPGLKGLYARTRFAGGGKVDDAAVTHWIEIGGKNMPGFKDVLKLTEVRALIAYLKTL